MSTIWSASATVQCPTRLSPAQGLIATLQRWWVTYTAWRIERLAASRPMTTSDRVSIVSAAPAPISIPRCV
jgi:hypothetical protein